MKTLKRYAHDLDVMEAIEQISGLLDMSGAGGI